MTAISALMDSAVVLVLHRARGRLTLTEAECRAVLDADGGGANLRDEIVRAAPRPGRIESPLVSSPPQDAELLV